MMNLNGRNGSSSSVVVRPRLLPTALAILMKMYSTVQDHKATTKPSVIEYLQHSQSVAILRLGEKHSSQCLPSRRARPPQNRPGT